MLSIVTGINGIGKTAVLHTILNGYLYSKNILPMSNAIELTFRDANTNKRFFLHSTLQPDSYLAVIASEQQSTDGILDVVASYMGFVICISSGSNRLFSIGSESSKLSHLMLDDSFRSDNRPWNLLATLTNVKQFVIYLVEQQNVKVDLLNTFLKENKFIYQVHTLARKYFVRVLCLFV
jgi:hypothetical protein